MPLFIQHGIIEWHGGREGCSVAGLYIRNQFGIAHNLYPGVVFDNLHPWEVEGCASFGHAAILIVIYLVPQMQASGTHAWLEPASVLEQAAHTHDSVARKALDLGDLHIAVFIHGRLQLCCKLFVNFYVHIRQQVAFRHEVVYHLCPAFLRKFREGSLIDCLASARHERSRQDKK